MKATKLFLAMGVAAMLTICVFVGLTTFERNASSAVYAAPSSNAFAATKQLWHCGMHPQVIQDHPGECPICHMALTPLAASDVTSAAGIRIDPRVVQNMGITTAAVSTARLQRTLRTVGIVSLPDTGLRDVSLKVNGWIEKLFANQEGMHVGKGEPLFDVYSPELFVAAQELASASRSLRGVSNLESKDAREQAQRLVDTAKRKLRLWDVSEADVDAIVQTGKPPETFTFRSPISGHVEQKMIVEGAGVQAGTKLVRIADHSTMWLVLDVFPDQIPSVKIGQAVTASIEGLPGRSFDGKVTFLYPHVDHATRTLKLRVTLKNPDFALKPGMYATAELHAVAPDATVLCPSEAVIDTGSRQIVFVPEGDGHFIARQVTVGQSGDNGMIEILRGLSSGDEVVTSGQFLMDVESRTVDAVRKLAAEETTNGVASTQGAPARPTTAEANAPLTLVYCPMVKATWIQSGHEITNPYLGQQMLDCGEIRGSIKAPEAGMPLHAVVESYLKATRAMLDGKLDEDARKRLTDAGDKLPSSRFKEFKAAIAKFTASTDIKAARDALPALSEQLQAALPSTTRK